MDKENKKNVEDVSAKKKRGRPKKVVEQKAPEEVELTVEPIIREVIVEKKVGFNFLEVIIIMIVTVLFGAFLGSAITLGANKIKEAGNGKVPADLQELVETYQNLLDNYYEEVDKEKLLDAGIEGMLKYLGDPYSTYMDVEETEAFNERVEGSYVGIGTEIQKNNDVITISNPFENGPAAKAGLQKGDIVKKVNGQTIEGKSLSEISALIKGKKGTTVKVEIERDGEVKEFSVTRNQVDLTSVTKEMFERNGKKIGYLKIDLFAANTYTQFKKALEELEKDGIQSLMIDVRNNSGGYLTTVTDMVSLFLDKSQVIYQIETKGVKEKVYSMTNDKKTYPVAILVNGGSASASEILTAALKESYHAEVIGTKTYGKGTVQKTFSLDSGATIKYTTQKWLTPDGNWIHQKGIDPTIEIELDDSYYENPSYDTDNQLQKAIDTLSQK